MGCGQSCPAVGDEGPSPTIQRIDDIDGKGIQVAFFASVFAAILASAAILLLDRPGPTPARRRLLRGTRIFLLSLSDQQLITGLAMAATAYLRICSIQVFSFLVAWHMATLSFVVHCLTLFTLRDPFHRALRPRGGGGGGDGGGRAAWLRVSLALVNALAMMPPIVHAAGGGGLGVQGLLAAPAACLLDPGIFRHATAQGIVAFSLSLTLAVAAIVLLGVYLFRDVPPAGGGRTSRRRFLPLVSGGLICCAVVLMLVTTGMLTWAPAEPGLVFEEDDDRWGFGQILAIFLLMLTVLQVLPVELEGPTGTEGTTVELTETEGTELLPLAPAAGAEDYGQLWVQRRIMEPGGY